MPKPQKVGGPKIYEAFDRAGNGVWTCWQKADGEFTRGWGKTPNHAYNDWLYQTCIAEGASVKDANVIVADADYA